LLPRSGVKGQSQVTDIKHVCPINVNVLCYGSNIHSSIFKQEYIKWNLLELRAAFIARAQIQTTHTSDFILKAQFSLLNDAF
jgi:hypothetical protein